MVSAGGDDSETGSFDQGLRWKMVTVFDQQKSGLVLMIVSTTDPIFLVIVHR